MTAQSDAADSSTCSFNRGAVDANRRPVFILGATRSGTSAITYALHRAGFAGASEGHVIPLLSTITRVLENWYNVHGNVRGLQLHTVPVQEVSSAIISTFEQKYFNFRSGQRWYDKTPGPQMICSIPLIREIWPDAQFIFCKRRGIENVNSQIRYFRGARSFDVACNHWAECMLSWHAVRHLASDHYIEIDQMEMLRYPEEVSRFIADLLVLDDNARTKFAIALRRSLLGSTSTNLEYRAVDSYDWTDDQKRTFYEICGDAMTLFSYWDVKEGVSTVLLAPNSSDLKVKTANLIHELKPDEADGSRFILVPNNLRRATVTFDDISLNGHNFFDTLISLGDLTSEEVAFGFEIHQGSKQIAFREEVLPPGGNRHLTASFAPIYGTVKVVLWTRMAVDGAPNDFAWPFWRTPSFRLYEENLIWRTSEC